MLHQYLQRNFSHKTPFIIYIRDKIGNVKEKRYLFGGENTLTL